MPDRVTVLSAPIDRLDMDATVAACERLIAARTPARHMAVNAAKLVAMQSDTRLREAVTTADVISADGQVVVWVSRLLGDALPERVAGIDLMWRLLARSEQCGYRVFVLGARSDALAEAVARIKRVFPRLALTGSRDGYFNDAETPHVQKQIRAAAPDILFVAMSSPRKEYFAADNAEAIGVPLVIGVGGAIDIIAGRTRRAPSFVQALGLEWLFRLGQEPRRLARRYAVTNTRFIGAVAADMIRRRRALTD